MVRKIILIVLAIIIVGGLSYVVTKKSMQSKNNNRQAVFMTNGQVYFGIVAGTNKEYITLKDVYYLKGEDLTKLNDSTDSQKKMLLVKMGNELHDPQDSMHISKEQVLFFQELKNESRINVAIQKFVDQKQSSTVEQASVTK